MTFYLQKLVTLLDLSNSNYITIFKIPPFNTTIKTSYAETHLILRKF